MHAANHFYGHAHIMARYADLPRPFMIWGYLQHGWNLLDGFAVGTRIVPGVPLFVWSDAVARRGWAMGRRDYRVIGSAWAYLLDLEPQPETAQREGTIFYPFHGWEGQEVTGDHQQMLKTLQEVEEGPITVCLYWNEHRVPAIREVYEKAGCRVISHGLRGFNYAGTDERFLYKQLAELRAHRRVVSNRLSSAIFYGASVGCEVGVYGDPMVLQDEHPAFGGVQRQERLWPELHQERVPQELIETVTAQELGLGHVRSPEEIRELFRWPEPEDLKS
jgi:hypothetical protein